MRITFLAEFQVRICVYVRQKRERSYKLFCNLVEFSIKIYVLTEFQTEPFSVRDYSEQWPRN